MSPLIVVAGVLFEGGKVLLTQRKTGVHLAGMWEFPGGKVADDEDPRDALVRELREEIAIEVTVGAPIENTYWRYPQRSVLLLFYEVFRTKLSPKPRIVDVADMRWASRADLDTLTFPPADVDVVNRIRARLSG